VALSRFNYQGAGEKSVPETLSAPGSPLPKPTAPGGRPVSVIGWSIAVLAGLLIWALAFLIVG
jgi:hypothetical protein